MDISDTESMDTLVALVSDSYTSYPGFDSGISNLKIFMWIKPHEIWIAASLKTMKTQTLNKADGTEC